MTLDLFEHARAGDNAPELSVSEISGAVRRVLEGEFGRVRVRGEIGRVSRPASGHVYFDLKDDRACLGSIVWRSGLRGLQIQPQEGMEVVATGRITTHAGASKYQLIVDALTPAGVGALMAMLEQRKRTLAAEGLFAAERKRPLPYLPELIGVVTSPSGAVIRDILHRLRERFPRPVLLWPVTVQGERCAPEVAAAIRGLNALAATGRAPDVIIVARGGGSLEDLWGFNDEAVVRAVAASQIPVISAVGHETDTTLVDLAADRRAPTPTAAAEMAVPVRLDLVAALDGIEARRRSAALRLLGLRGQRLRDLGRLLPRPEALLSERTQRVDGLGSRLPRALIALARDRRLLIGRGPAGRFGPALLGIGLERRRQHLVRAALGLRTEAAARQFTRLHERLVVRSDRLERLERRKTELARGRLAVPAARLTPGLVDTAHRRQRLDLLAARLASVSDRQVRDARGTLDLLARTLGTLGPESVLARGFAIVRGSDDRVLTRAAAARAETSLSIEFADGRVAVRRG